MYLSKIKTASIVLVFILLLTLPPLVFAQTETNTSDATTNVDGLLQYEWPQIHGDSGFTRFSEGPAPEVSDILWKTNVTGIESYLTAFNGKIFATTTTNVIALDKDTGATVWNTTLPSSQRWPAVFKIDDERLVIGPYCLETETGDILWTSQDFSAKVSYWAEGVYSQEELIFFTHGESTVQAWNFSDPTHPPEMIWETFVPGSSGSGAGIQYGDGKVFPGSFEPHQIALDAKTGEVLWDTQTTAAMTFSGSYYNGKLYKAGEHDNKFYCFDAENGKILWTTNAGTHLGYWVSGSAAAYGKIYELNKDGHLYALDADTGEIVWKYEGPGYYFWPGWPVVADGKVYATTGQRVSSDPYTFEYSKSEFVCLDAFTGTLAWSLPIEAYSPRESVAVAYGNLYLIPGYIEENKMNTYIVPGEVWAIGSGSWSMWRGDLENTGVGESAPAGLNLRWAYTTGGGVVSSASVVDGLAYFGSQDKNVYCVDARTGMKLWSFATEARIKSSPAVDNGRVYVGPDDGNVYCLDAYNGSLIWEADAGGFIEAHLDSVARVASSPAVYGGKVYVGSLDTNMYCFDAATGDLVWNYETEGYINSSPAISGGAVYIVSQEPSSGGLYKLDADDGGLVWKFEIPYFIAAERGTDMHASPTVADGMVFVATNKDFYHAVNAQTGTLEWTYNVTRGTESSGGFLVGSAAYHDGKLFVVDQFFITCLDAQTGTSVWKSWLGGEIYVSPTYADGKVYAATDRRSIYVLNATNGDRISYYSTGSNTWSSPSVYEGRLYIGNHDWNLYCLAESSVTFGEISAGPLSGIVTVGEAVAGCGQLSLKLAYAPVTVCVTKPDSTIECMQVTAQHDGSFSFGYTPESVGQYTISIWCTGASFIMKSEIMQMYALRQDSQSKSSVIPVDYVYLTVALIAVVVIVAVVLILRKKRTSSPVTIN